ncbi:MAG: hypothetical protein A2X49_04680 [Lentisphaerae bacterium GWF2_52_8]|nr:MAG: hypothetical protein A2X49_04680 [Lentisphaerae bacterium GWF2_52_8]
MRYSTESSMNGRQRLFAALNGEPSDHVPIWLLFPYHKTSYYADVKTLLAWREIHELSMKKAITLNRRNLQAPLFSPEVRITDQNFEEGAAQISRTSYEWRNVRLFSEIFRSPKETKVKKLLENEEDLEAFCSLPLARSSDIIPCLDSQLAQYKREFDEFPKELGSMMLDLGEPIAALYNNSNLEEFAIWSLSRNDLVESFLQKSMAYFRTVYSYCLERNLSDLYFMVGSELAAPPLVGIDTFRKWIVPFSAELTRMIHSKNCKVIQHFHGQVKNILPYFLEIGADALHTIEAPPIGNCTMSEAYAATGGRMTLIGNIQYDDFCRWDSAKIEAETLRLLEECRGKRFILSPTAGPYDPNPPETLLKNYKTFLETAWNHDWP